MDYRSIFAISASGLIAEKTRLDVTAANLANINTGKGVDGKLYQPLRVQLAPATSDFAAGFGAALGGNRLAGVQVVGIEAVPAEPRMVYEPGSVDADEKGYVARPGINHLNEMINMTTALRAYQANVAAFNASKSMAQEALKLGGGQ